MQMGITARIRARTLEAVQPPCAYDLHCPMVDCTTRDVSGAPDTRLTGGKFFAVRIAISSHWPSNYPLFQRARARPFLWSATPSQPRHTPDRSPVIPRSEP